MMTSIWTASIVFITFGYGINTAEANYKKVKTSFEFTLIQQVVGQVRTIEDEADFQKSLGADIIKTFNASTEDVETSTKSSWETVDISYKLITNLEDSYSLAVRDNMEKVIKIGEYVFSYNGISFKSEANSLNTSESWKEIWYEIGHQLIYAAIVAIIGISIFAVAVHYTCRWGKRRQVTEGRYVLNETPRTSRAMPSGKNPYAEEMTSEGNDPVEGTDVAIEMNGHPQSNGGVSEKIELKTLEKETPQGNGGKETPQGNEKDVGTENKGFENDENSMFAKLVYSEYSVPEKHSHEFL